MLANESFGPTLTVTLIVAKSLPPETTVARSLTTVDFFILTVAHAGDAANIDVTKNAINTTSHVGRICGTGRVLSTNMMIPFQNGDRAPQINADRPNVCFAFCGSIHRLTLHSCL